MKSERCFFCPKKIEGFSKKHVDMMMFNHLYIHRAESMPCEKCEKKIEYPYWIFQKLCHRCIQKSQTKTNA